MKIFFTLIMIIAALRCDGSEIFHYHLSDEEQEKTSFIWEQDSLAPFDELIVSWNAQRPQKGAYLIQLSVLNGEWSSWLDYAFWSYNDQYTFNQQTLDSNFRVYQDAFECLNGIQATGFRIRLLAKDREDLKEFRSVHICATYQAMHWVCACTAASRQKFVDLTVPKISQMALPDERNTRLCSPTATTAVIQYLSKSPDLLPLAFADRIHFLISMETGYLI
jgi:hypothetical protein